MKNMTTFQMALLGLCIAAVVVALGVFALFSTGGNTAIGRVTIWGTMPAPEFTTSIEEVNKILERRVTVDYVEKREKDFNQELVEALASGKGPDLVLIPHDLMTRQQDKFFTINGESLPLRDYLDTFINESELYITNEGILALPLGVDPLVTYWNRDIFFNKSIPNPPTTWTEVGEIAPKISQKDSVANLTRSAVALGESMNVQWSKEILSALIMQTGNAIVVRRQDGGLQSILADDLGLRIPPAEAAVTFYTDFANPSRPQYSWNRALPNSRNMFAAGDLALYFGFASEYESFAAKNPNLNYDVAPFPQLRDAKSRSTFGRMYGLSVLKASPKVTDAFETAVALSGTEFSGLWTKALKMAPARRSMLGTLPADPALSVAYSSALTAKGWLDPDSAQTSAFWKTMIEDVTSGRASVQSAVSDVSSKIQALFK